MKKPQKRNSPIDVAKHLYHLPRTRSDLDALHKDVVELSHRDFAANEHIRGDITSVRNKQDEIDERMRSLDDRLTDILHQLTILNEKTATTSKKAAAPSSPSTGSELIADDHSLDNFYVHFERWFRGTEAEIAKNQSVYLPLFTKSKIDSKKFPVVDVGCGNGEFVQILHDKGIRAIGLDLNKTMIDNVKSKGLEGERGDALNYLRKQKNNSLMAVTGFHIVEHIPFVELMKLFTECYRVLAPGGFVIFETPNPENVIVGSCNFYNDPSHLHPLPPAFLELVMKTRGFSKTEIKRLHPLKEKIESKDPLVQEMAERFFGPQDYSVIATK